MKRPLKIGQHFMVPLDTCGERPCVGQRIEIEGGTATVLTVTNEGIVVTVDTVDDATSNA